MIFHPVQPKRLQCRYKVLLLYLGFSQLIDTKNIATGSNPSVQHQMNE